ncbi:MAG: response regulator [Acidobacteria bacterium]|nr:response regulator [Acidobacteriota bacterium]
MKLSGDLELERLFGGEVEERSGLLANGARVLATGDFTDGLLEDMCREGHTIKGTARMMGFSAVSDAGKLLEDAWRELRDGEQTPDQALADALEALSLELLPALAADPATGTPELAEGMRAVRQAMRGDAIPLDKPPTKTISEPSDLGGLLGTLDSEGFGETIRVNAAALFRLINEICSLRVDAEAVHGAVEQVEDSIDDRAELAVSMTTLTGLIATAEKAVIDVQDQAVNLAAAPLSDITSTYPQLVRYLARKAGKDVRFEIIGDHHQVDRQVLERLSDPLRHLLANAINHGVELPAEREALGKPRTATLAIGFDVVDHRLTISVEDDGSGIDWGAVREMATQRGLLDEPDSGDLDALRAVLFSPYFSTAQPGELVGDGMGLATVAEAVEALHGTLVLKSEAGSGTRLMITVPTSHALQDAVIIRAAGQMWGIPEIAVIDRVPIDSAEFVETPSRTEMIWNGTTIPVTSFAEAVGLRALGQPSSVLVVSSPVGPVGFSVEEDLGRRQVAARELGPVLDGVPHLTGAALLGGGDIVVLVDAAKLAERTRKVPDPDAPRRRVFIVDDSRGARQVVGGALGSAGFEVDLAGSPTEALSVLAEQEFDAIVLDYVLPTMDGATLVARVRDLGITAPIVVLSGAATVEDQEKALAAGANAYLDKDDVREGALATLLRELIE